MKAHLRLIIWGLLCLMISPLSAQITLVKKHKPVARICVTGQTESDKQAAELLQDSLERRLFHLITAL